MNVDIRPGCLGLVNLSDDLITDLHVPFICIIVIDGISIVAITTAKEQTDKNMIGLGSDSLIACSGGHLAFRSGQNKRTDIFQTTMIIVLFT